MQRAAAGLADEIRNVLGQRAGRRPGTTGSILLLAGSGDNGGDGLRGGTGRGGVDVTVVATGPRMHDGGLSAALVAGAHLASVTPGGVALLAARVDVVVDAIVGTGTSPNPALRGAAREIVAAILPIVSAPEAPAIVGPVHLSPCATSTLASGNLRAELNIGSPPPGCFVQDSLQEAQLKRPQWLVRG